jgi:hypothetical protein
MAWSTGLAWCTHGATVNDDRKGRRVLAAAAQFGNCSSFAFT